MTIKLSLKKHVLLNISFTTDIVFLLKSDKDEHRTRLVTTRNACPAMPANTSSRKSFTATRLSSSSTDDIGIPTCIRKIRGCTIIRTRVGGTSHTRKCTRMHTLEDCAHVLDTRIGNVLPELASILPIRWICLGSFFFSFSLSSILVYTFSMTSLLLVLRAVSRIWEMRLQSHTSSPCLPFPLFFSRESWVTRRVRNFPLPSSWRRETSSRIGWYFHPNTRQSATLVYVFG